MADELVNRIFEAPLASQERKTCRGASLLRVPEAVIFGGKRLQHTRVKIDPWTGGAFETALFTNNALYGGRLNLRLELKGLKQKTVQETGQINRAALGLMVLAIRDLACGMVPVGGEGGNGRVWLKAPESAPFLRITTWAGEGSCFDLFLASDEQ